MCIRYGIAAKKKIKSRLPLNKRMISVTKTFYFHPHLIMHQAKLYFVALFFLFPLRRTILKCEKKFFLCYRDQKKWIKGKVCQLEAEGRELVMFPRFTFSDRDNIGNVFEHFKIVIRSERNRKNNATECFFAFFLTFLRQKKKMTGKKKNA